MTGDGEFVNAGADDKAEQSKTVVPTVHDGEFVNDDPATPADRRTNGRRFRDWWVRSRRVPAAVKSREGATRAAREAAIRLLPAPFGFLRAVGRGLVVAARGWRRWVRVHDYREAAEQSEKLADKFVEIRALTLLRWKVTGAVTLGFSVAATVAHVMYGARALWTVAMVAAVALAIVGRRKDGSPGRKAVLSGPRSLTWTMDPQVLVDAFRDAKLIGKDESLRLVERANRIGEGWAITVDLPATRKAADVIKNRDALASALAVDEVQLMAERVRGRGGHAGRVSLWVADDDPYAVSPLPTPLLKVQWWDAWRPVPFGRDARDRKIDLPLVWTSLLVGAIPRQGKTFAARLAAAGLILDPYTRLYVYDGKGGKDWRAAEAISHRFVCGDEPGQIEAVRDGLAELVAETQARFARMSTLDDEVCPESKITPAISRDRRLDMPITAVIIDEVQVYLEDSTKVEVGGRKTTMGTYIADLLTYLAKKGPAAGIIVIVATQRPDSNTIPSRLRAVLGSRFALRVMDWRDSNIILGEQMNSRGYDSSRLLASHKGVGVLRPDGETDSGSDALAVTVRTYYMPNTDWKAICEQGRDLRESAGTLSGHAAGHDPAAVLDPAAVARAIGTSAAESEQPAPTEVPEPLASVIEYLADDLDADGREFVPSAELVEALDADATSFGREMGALGCRPRQHWLRLESGERKQFRGYRVAELRAVVAAWRAGERIEPEDG
jgi:S-DNA-T family DNA segregation ATPase FtsK/SpoIIIE